MARRVALIFLEPAAGRADDFDRWLADELVPGLLLAPSVESVQQFAAREEFLVFPPPPGRTVLLAELDDSASAAGDAAAHLAAALSAETVGIAADASRVRACLLDEFRTEMRVDGLPDGFRARQPRDLLVFFLGPVAGREEQYHEWYDRAHIRNGLTLEGFVTGQRFRVGPAILEAPLAPSEFAAVYEIDGADLDTAIDSAKSSAGRHEQSTAADAASMRAFALSSVGPAVRQAPSGSHAAGHAR